MVSRRHARAIGPAAVIMFRAASSYESDEASAQRSQSSAAALFARQNARGSGAHHLQRPDVGGSACHFPVPLFPPT